MKCLVDDEKMSLYMRAADIKTTDIKIIQLLFATCHLCLITAVAVRIPVSHLAQFFFLDLISSYAQWHYQGQTVKTTSSGPACDNDFFKTNH